MASCAGLTQFIDDYSAVGSVALQDLWPPGAGGQICRPFV